MKFTINVSKKNLDVLQDAVDILAGIECTAYSHDLENLGCFSSHIKLLLNVLLFQLKNEDPD